MEKKTCGECRHYNKRHMFCHKKGFKWLCDDDKACEDFDPIPKPTVFQKITQSPEVLAPLLVHIIVCEEDTSIKGWTSNVVQSVFETYEEAFAATVEKLKEVEK